MAPDQPGFRKTKLNTVVRRPPRGHYDFKTIHALINETTVLHVGFAPPPSAAGESDAFPTVLPMLGCTGNYEEQDSDPTKAPQHIYLHGSISARMLHLPEKRAEDGDADEEGVPMCITATKLDGLVLALASFNHSCNYRSAVVYGHAQAVTDQDEKNYAMTRITNSVVHDRWEHTRLPVTSTEFNSTGILRVTVRSASAKVRCGPQGDDRHDLENEELKDRVWVGVVPSYTVLGEPMESELNRVKAVPSYLNDFIKGQNDKAKQEAYESLKNDKGEMKLRETHSSGGFLSSLWKS